MMVVLGGAHTTPLAVAHVPAVLCVCTVTQGAQLTSAGRLVAMHQCSARLSWTPQETVGVAAKLTLHVGGPPSYSACWTPTTPTLAYSPSVQPTSTGHPPRFVVEACSEGPSHERMANMCKHGSPPPAPPTTTPRRRMAINTPGSCQPILAPADGCQHV